MLTVDELAAGIDHSIIDPFHTADDMRAGIELARRYRTGRFVTQPFRVRQAKRLLEGSGIGLQPAGRQCRSAHPRGGQAGVVFIKTSTGTRPDRVEDVEAKVRLLRSILRPKTGIKASGGVYSLDAALAYYRAGANRFGASETAAILDEYRARCASGELAELSIGR